MKVLILYASSGAGHQRAASAIYNYLKEKCPPWAQLQLVDCLARTNRFFSFFYRLGYSFLVRRAIWLWRLCYFVTDFKYFRRVVRSFASGLNRFHAKSLSGYLITESPDVIISTHFFCSEIAAGLKKSNKIKSRVITVLTDFSVHPFWISQGTDSYFVPSEYAKMQLLASGVSSGRIKVFTIPVDLKFSRPHDKNELSKKFGIDKDKFTLLIMTGSFGVGPIYKLVKLLYQEVQVLAVCAANRRLYSRLSAENLPNVKVFPFVENTDELMAVSDLIVTKPGGLSIAEAINMELVPIFIHPIPGQEENNIRVLQDHGVGLTFSSLGEIKKIIISLRDNPEKLKNLKESCRNFRKPGILEELGNVVCQSSAGYSS
ncbi:MAG: glycosyltransferase [Candidatus Omnitrophota bacterium]